MKVINLFAGPGAGKSTTAAGLFFLMKSRGFRVELVTEYAKDLVYEGDYATLQNQAAILREQDYRQRRLISQVDYAITDSPLLLGLAYLKAPFNTERMRQKIIAMFRSYTNYNFYVVRKKDYAEYGRVGTEDRAKTLDTEIRRILDEGSFAYVPIVGDNSAPENILTAMGLR